MHKVIIEYFATGARFRAFSAFARAVPALLLDHASGTGFLPELAAHLKPVQSGPITKRKE